MATKYIDLSGYSADDEVTEADYEQVMASLERLNFFTNKINAFIEEDYKKFSIAQLFPDSHPFKKEDVYLWERILAHKTLWKYVSDKIATQWKLAPSQISWEQAELEGGFTNPVDITTSEIIQRIDTAVTGA